MLKELINKITGRKEKVVDSFKYVDVNDLKMPQITISYNTKDYGEKYVGRLFDVDKPTNVIVIKDTLEELVKDIQESFVVIDVFGRMPEDDPVIVCIYWIRSR